MSETRSALLIVDVQKDFCPGGSLPVPDGDQVVAPLNGYIAEATVRGFPIYASRDWHPPVTRHFRPYGGQWPPHCVQNTDGASFHNDLQLPASTIVISKGQDPNSPGYSAFEGSTSEGRPLLSDLREHQIGHLYVGGLATDYCVKHSVLDALRFGFRVTVLRDAIAGVDADAGDSMRAIDEMLQTGADIKKAL
jgi:nicotinamidase/pyrazinamidase